MADYSRSCDIHQGFSVERENHETVGYITALKMGDKALDADLEVNTPEGKAKVVAVLSGISVEVSRQDGEGGVANVSPQPICFSGQVSVKNREPLVKMVFSDLAEVKVEIKFVVWEFDHAKDQKKYFKSFHSNEALVKGFIRKSGKALELSVDHSQNSEIQSPPNYGFSLAVVPTREKQSLALAVSVNGKVTISWIKAKDAS